MGVAMVISARFGASKFFFAFDWKREVRGRV